MPKGVLGVPKSLVVFLAAKVGLRKATKVAAFIVGWGQCSDRIGHEPNFREYSEFWVQSEASTFRELALFHQVWPNDRTPKRVWDWCRDQVEATDRDVATAEALSAKRRRWA